MDGQTDKTFYRSPVSQLKMTEKFLSTIFAMATTATTRPDPRHKSFAVCVSARQEKALQTDRPTDRPTDGPTNQRTDQPTDRHSVLLSRVHATKNAKKNKDFP